VLSGFEIDLLCDGRVIDHRHSANVLDGPISAPRHLVDSGARSGQSTARGRRDSNDRHPHARLPDEGLGETWCTALTGITLDCICLRFD
jgi:2-oxo-3-hexenedioate decarboxylase